MSVLDLIDYRRQFSPPSLIQRDTEDFADPIRRQPPQTDLAASLEDLVDGEVAFENEVPAVFDLCDRIEPRQAHLVGSKGPRSDSCSLERERRGGNLQSPQQPVGVGGNNSSTVMGRARSRCARAYWIISSSACRLGAMPYPERKLDSRWKGDFATAM